MADSAAVATLASVADMSADSVGMEAAVLSVAAISPAANFQVRLVECRAFTAATVSFLPIISDLAVLFCTTVFATSVSALLGSGTIVSAGDAAGVGLPGGERLITIRGGGGIRMISDSMTIITASTRLRMR
jgi:hypothetical protein